MKHLLSITLIFGLISCDTKPEVKLHGFSVGERQWLIDDAAFTEIHNANEACPASFQLPNLNEWNELINFLPGKINTRGGKLVPNHILDKYGLRLNGMGQADTVLFRDLMGFYWTSSDTMKTFFREPDLGDQRHLIGIHIWSSGESDSINIEPTYMLAKDYELNNSLSVKCVSNY